MASNRPPSRQASFDKVPSATTIAEDLWKVARSGLPNFDVEIHELPVLRELGVMLPVEAEPPATRADLQRAIRLAIRSVDSPSTMRRLEVLLDGASPLEQRFAALGRLISPRRGTDPLTAKTVRNSGRAKALVEDLATVLRDQEIRFRATGERPDGVNLPIATVGPRAASAIYEEERLGYRWVTYERTLTGPDKDWVWEDTTKISIQALRPITSVELPITVPVSNYPTQIKLDFCHYNEDGSPLWFHNLSPESFESPDSHHDGRLRKLTPWKRSVVTFPAHIDTAGKVADLVFRRHTPSAFETDETRHPNIVRDPPMPPRQIISTCLEVALLFDSVETLTHEIHAHNYPLSHSSYKATALHLVGDTQVHQTKVPTDVKFVYHHVDGKERRAVGRLRYDVDAPTAGTTYSLEGDLDLSSSHPILDRQLESSYDDYQIRYRV